MAFKRIEVPITTYDASPNPRSHLRHEIERHWVGCKNSIVGLQYLDLVNGIIYLGNRFERRDLLVVQFHGICNVFIEPDQHQVVQPFEGVELTEADRLSIFRICSNIVQQRRGYFKTECRFLDEEPWRMCVGKSPEEAVEMLKTLGW